MKYPDSIFLLNADIALLRWVNGFSGRLPALDFAMTMISSSLFWLLLGGLVFFLVLKSGNSSTLSRLVFALISLGVADLVSFEIIKPMIARERPCWSLEGLNLVLGACGGSYGFTSNHAANAAAFAFAIVSSKAFNWQTAMTVVFGALLVGLSRVYLGVHYPGDVVGGFFLGVFVTVVLRKLKLEIISDYLSRKTIRWTFFLRRKHSYK